MLLYILSWVKALAVVYMACMKMKDLRESATKWSSKNSHMQWPASLMLNWNAMLCLFIVVYKFTAKDIGPLYFLWAIAMISFQSTFLVLVYGADSKNVTEEGIKLEAISSVAPQPSSTKSSVSFDYETAVETIGSQVKLVESPVHRLIEMMPFLGADAPARLFKLLGLQVMVLIFGMFWHSECNGVFLYPLAFQASTILFIFSYFVASQYQYEGLERGDVKDKLAHKRFKTFFGKYH